MSQEEFQEEKKRVDSIYMHYREQAGNTISSVVIISAGLIGILVSSGKPDLDEALKVIFYLFGVIPIFLSIFLGVLAKYLYFFGYKRFAQSEYEYFESENMLKEGNSHQKRETARNLFDESNGYFDSADKYTNSCGVVFLIGLLAIFIIYSLHFFNI